MIRSTLSGVTFIVILSAMGCSPAPLPPPVTQADAVARSQAATEAEELSPQAFAAAEKLRAEANWLYDEGQLEAASVAGEQAVAGYNEAFALARAAKASNRMATAQKDLENAQKTVTKLDTLQGQIDHPLGR